jgi:hypothetical protein
MAVSYWGCVAASTAAGAGIGGTIGQVVTKFIGEETPQQRAIGAFIQLGSLLGGAFLGLVYGTGACAPDPMPNDPLNPVFSSSDDDNGDDTGGGGYSDKPRLAFEQDPDPDFS